jgi:RHS repeat-associated protein
MVGTTSVDVYIVHGTPASTSTLATSDFSNVGTTAWSSDIPGTSLSINAYNTLDLNATAVAAINRSGWTNYALREGNDFNNSAPTETTAVAFNYYLSEQTGTSQDPYLSVTYSTSTTATSTGSGPIQDIRYTYDAVGNITLINNNSGTMAVGTSTYLYDELNRLTEVDTINMGTGVNYSKQWTYNWLGDIVSSPDKGFYTYAGNTGGSYANPDAVTSNASSTYTYDNNGNLLTGDSFTNTWDYRNRLTQTQLNGTTTSYLYDIGDERVALGANGATTTYPFTFYNVATSSGGVATITKHIFANGEPVADVQGSTTTAKVYYIHDDALGGANVLSNASGTLAEVIEYYPFGGIRLDQRATSTPFGEQRRFTGHEFDGGTGLNYMDARYEGPTLSRFLSEDPNFVSVGASTWESNVGTDPTLAGFVSSGNTTYLGNPQNLNSYSYVNDNPLRFTDPCCATNRMSTARQSG